MSGKLASMGEVIGSKFGFREAYGRSWDPPEKTKTENFDKSFVSSDESFYDRPGKVLALLGQSIA